MQPYVYVPILRKSFHPVKLGCALTGGGVYLIGVSLGYSILWPIFVLIALIEWVWSWDGGDWVMFGRVIAGLLGVCAFIFVISLIDGGDAPPASQGFNLPAVQNFRDESPYGDAALADRAAIQRAMIGHRTPYAPKFRE